jgi:DNA-binding transcriptional ArsR family regulator
MASADLAVDHAPNELGTLSAVRLLTTRGSSVNSFLDSTACAQVLKAMGDATRLRILRSLVEHPKTVAELVAELKIDQPKASHHLAILRHAGLVRDMRDGRQVSYWLHPTVHRQLSESEGLIDLGCCSVGLKKE